MTDKNKISILERLLHEQEDEIKELQEKNEELETIIKSYECISDNMVELRQTIKKANNLNEEFKKINKDMIKIKKMYAKDLGALR